ncbi:benzoate/H(+) symporter BenE family transporter [Sphingomonas sp. DT-51]|uniref:benzoate/H(+) symporter BenE family transporter n=1 Tax=Sphingomonas sp. DT-51 TaxID=3396165 RepID=UPI003F1D33D4
MIPLPPLSAFIAAVVAAIIGFGGTVALVVQAMQTLGATPSQIGSAVTALCLGIAAGSAALSIWRRVPVILAWSTPGAALLAATPGLTWSMSIGIFLVAALAAIAMSAVPALTRLAAALPAGLAAAMLAGVLMPFCLQLFRLGSVDPLLVVTIVAVFVLTRQRRPTYALLAALGAGIALALARNQIGQPAPGATLGSLIPVAPTFDAVAIVSVGLPLFFVTLVSQNLPGLAVLQGSGYQEPPGPLLLGTGLASLVVAFFGGHAVNLAAITAAICTSEDADPEADRRWMTGVIYAGCYVLLAAFSPLLVRQLLALPGGLIAALTGVALIPPLSAALATLFTEPRDRDAALLTFLVTASGVLILGLGPALWGLVAGIASLAAARVLRRSATAQESENGRSRTQD